MDLQEKARLINIKSKIRILSFLEGGNRIFSTGDNDDIKNIREYSYGDDIRKINWIITARERKPYIVEREQLKNKNIKIIILLDKNFLFKTKLEKLIEVYSLLSYASLFQRDKLSLAVLTDRVEVDTKIKNVKDTEKTANLLSSTEINKKVLDIEKLNLVLPEQRSILILIGDFIYKLELTPKILKHHLFFIKIRDKDEENPAIYINRQLRSFDNRRKIPVLARDIVKEYIKNLKDIDVHNEKIALKYKIHRKKIYTYEDPLFKLVELFSSGI